MQVFGDPACFFKDSKQSYLRDCASEKFLLVKRCLFALAVERRKAHVFISFRSRDIQKIVTRTDFLNEL